MARGPPGTRRLPDKRFRPGDELYYPLPAVQTPQLLADVLYRKNLPLALVYFPYGPSYALALTGGGMDLSWEICFGYILAGYLPPFHFCDLPQYAVRPTGWRRLVLGACRRTCRIVNYHALKGVACGRGLHRLRVSVRR